MCHRCQRRWKANRPNAADVDVDAGGGGGDAGRGSGRGVEARSSEAAPSDAGVHILVQPYFDHFAACILLDRLELAARPHFWHHAPPPPPPSPPPPPPLGRERSRL